MKWIPLILTVLGVLIAPLAASASDSQPGEPTAGGVIGGGVTIERSPTLRIVSATPLIVAGAGFVAHERVTVTALTSLGPRVQRTHASATGAFRVRFGPFPQPCGKPFAVRARGATGDVAIARLAAPPCVPPPIR